MVDRLMNGVSEANLEDQNGSTCSENANKLSPITEFFDEFQKKFYDKNNEILAPFLQNFTSSKYDINVNILKSEEKKRSANYSRTFFAKDENNNRVLSEVISPELAMTSDLLNMTTFIRSDPNLVIILESLSRMCHSFCLKIESMLNFYNSIEEQLKKPGLVVENESLLVKLANLKQTTTRFYLMLKNNLDNVNQTLEYNSIMVLEMYNKKKSDSEVLSSQCHLSQQVPIASHAPQPSSKKVMYAGQNLEAPNYQSNMNNPYLYNDNPEVYSQSMCNDHHLAELEHNQLFNADSQSQRTIPPEYSVGIKPRMIIPEGFANESYQALAGFKSRE
ncbi:MAG: hypothetical protein MHPSP_001152 [Paramarteilia canceri]